MRRNASYIGRQPGREGYRYLRAVPKHLQPVVGLKAWGKYLGRIGEAEAITKGHALAHAHGRLISALERLTTTDRSEIIAQGGWVKLEHSSDARRLFVGMEAGMNADAIELLPVR